LAAVPAGDLLDLSAELVDGERLRAIRPQFRPALRAAGQEEVTPREAGYPPRDVRPAVEQDEDHRDEERAQQRQHQPGPPRGPLPEGPGQNPHHPLFRSDVVHGATSQGVAPGRCISGEETNLVSPTPADRQEGEARQLVGAGPLPEGQ
jgi:hypothetical protein